MGYVRKQRYKDSFRYYYHYKKFNGVRKSVSSLTIEDLKNRVVNEVGHEWLSDYERSLL